MKVIRTSFVMCFIAICITHSSAQSDWNCSADQYRILLEQHNPLLTRLRQESDASILEWKKNLVSNRAGKVTIPIVFHIIHNNGIENINDFQVLSAVNLLNAAFANTSPYDSSQGTDTEISFCLANQDPQGNPTNGINKVVSNLTIMDKDLDDAALKGLSIWPPSEYVNIWVVRDINSTSSGNNVAGYANFPYIHGTSLDGIVVEATNIGGTKEGGVVLAHEMGHYFGLYHTFEEGCKNDDCMLNGDRVCDTPPDQSREQTQCGDTMNSCLSDANSGFATDQNDLVQNFLDYNNPACMNQFTNGQKDRMMYFINKDRKSLLTSKGCQEPCPTPIMPSITFSTLNPQPYEMVNVINNTKNGVIYQWLVNGVPYSNQKQPTFSFPNEGINTILLQVIGATSNCSFLDTFIINAFCSPVADYNPKITDCIENFSGQLFTYAGDPSTSIEWYLNGVKIGTDLTVMPDLKAGINALKLVAKNQYCDNAFTTLISLSCIEDCSNKIDDDSDGLIDCFDGDCCDKCADFYYDPCLSDERCNVKKPFTIKQKWNSKVEIGTFGTPIVGDLENDGKTEIFMPTRTGLVAMDGKNGDFNYLTMIGNVNFRSTPTIADVDNDGKGELLVVGADNALYCIEEDGYSIKYTSANVVQPCCVTYLNTWCNVADLNYDGNVEIIIGNKVINGQNGVLLADGGLVGASEGIVVGANAKIQGNVTIANILRDNDPRYPPGLEIVTGNQVLSVDLNTGKVKIEVTYPGIGDGYGVASDFDGDNDLDVVTTSANRVMVWEGETPSLNRNVYLPYRVSTLPTICNIDDDKDLEMLICTETSFNSPGYIYALDNNFVILWRMKIGEHSAASPISFDFELDGKLEVLQRTDDSLYIFNGEDGTLLFKDKCGSGTLQEHATIADIDDDGFAELVIGCNVDPNNAYRGYLRAYEGASEEWPGVRPVWHTGLFYNTQINDDLSVPAIAQQFHVKGIGNGLNGFNTAIAKPEEPYVYNLKLQNLKHTRTCNPGFKVTLTFDVINGSNKSIAFKDCYTVYKNEPSQSDSKIVKVIKGIKVDTIRGGDTLHVTIEMDSTAIAPQEDATYCVTLNDLGQFTPPFDYPKEAPPTLFKECDLTDNKLCFRYQPRPAPSNVIDKKSFIICDGDSVKVKLISSWKTVQWYDGSSKDSIVIKTPGIYWVKAGDDLCNAKTDTLEVNFFESGLTLSLPDTLHLCNGNVQTIEAQQGFTSYRWNDGFPESSYTVYTKGKYALTATDACGNVYRDTTIVLQNKVEMSLPDSIFICPDIQDTILTDAKFKQIDLFPFANSYCVGCNTVRIVTDISRWHYLTAYAADGCIAVDSIYILKYSAPSYSADTKGPCNGQSNGSINIVIAIENNVVWLDNGSTDLKRNNLSTGIYYFKIIDKHLCTFFDSISLNESSEALIDVSMDKPCPNDNNGSITLSASTAYPLKYLWSNGRDSSRIDQLVAGQYKVTITDDSGCMYIDTIDLVNLDTITVKVDINKPCNDDNTGSINLTASNNFYKYKWGNEKTGPSIENIPPGNYSLTITDNNGCSKDYNFVLTTKTPPNVVNDTMNICLGDSVLIDGLWIKDNKTIEKVNASCDTLERTSIIFNATEYTIQTNGACDSLNNGSMTIESKDGRPITFEWQYEGQSMGDSLTNLFAGNYTITLTDAINCKQVFNISLPILEHDLYSIDSTFTQGYGKSIPLNLSNAGVISSIVWIPSDGLSCNDCINPICFVDSTTYYSIHITDVDGCSHYLNTKVKVANIPVEFPNIISPSSEIGNKFFEIKSKFPILYDIQIYDRWGSLVFNRINVKTDDNTNQWDGTLNGKPLLPGVYVYAITLEGQKPLWGTITLVK